MPDWLRDWWKIVLYALCTAVIFFVLYMLFLPSPADRYRVIAKDTYGYPRLYMDTSTGKIYRVRDGKLYSSPSSKSIDTLDELHKQQMILAAYDECQPLRVRLYTVVLGDSLWYISHKMDTDVETIRGSNNLEVSSEIRPGAMLRIPNQKGIFYTLKVGETVAEVAKRYDVSMTKIRLVNEKINIASLKANDEIFLPGAKPIANR